MKALPRELRIRCLRESDFVFADEVCSLAGWNQTLSGWKRFIGYEPDGCFLAEWNGQPAGTVTTTCYGTTLGWIGMMLVHPDFRRRGISSVLMRTALEYLRMKGVHCIKLDATPEGEPVYRKLGFKAEWKLHRWKADLKNPDSVVDAIKPSLGAGDRKIDLPVFGADRSAWLEKLSRDSRIVVRTENGFGMIRDGARANYLGPVVATCETAGKELLITLLGQTNGQTFWDIPDGNDAATEVAKQLGFAPVRSLLRMWLGEKNVVGDPRLQFAIGEPATG